MNANSANRLVHETSPYLRQHAHNPVHWQPWDAQALEQARHSGKPILLSIGYAACHWCHVMAHESFEDPATAAVMNAMFINIKVDREERPDLDKIYQAAFQLLHQRAGGWPLTMVLTPDEQIPLVGGTYFPKTARHGLPAFTDFLRRVSAYYHQHIQELPEHGQAMREALRATLNPPSVGGETPDLTVVPLQDGRTQLLRRFDPQQGGFGDAPKFPHPVSLDRLLCGWAASLSGDGGLPDTAALAALRLSLERMAAGGLYDHLGGGFYRYSVDAAWQIPHFEKMLYDNGLLLTLYSQAWSAVGDPSLRAAAEGIGEWVMAEMQAPQGGYYASLDADSESEEGKFYLWTPAQVQTVLDPQQYAAFAMAYGLDQPPNFEQRFWHLYAAMEPERIAQRLGIELTQVQTWLGDARRQLRAIRAQRVWPLRDEKILTAWNGLMIQGMAAGGRHLDRPDFVVSAERALAFIQAELWRNGRLLAVSMDGQARFSAYLDDYAFLLNGVLELLQCRWRNDDLELALALADGLLTWFEDREAGGFFFTAHDHEALIERPKPLHDEALPSGNGIAAQALVKLGYLTGQTTYLEAAERSLRWAWPELQQMPAICNSLLTALELYQNPPQIIMLRGAEPALTTWRARCTQPYAPRRLTLAIPTGAALPDGLWQDHHANDAPITAQVCDGLQCRPSVTTLAALELELARTEARLA